MNTIITIGRQFGSGGHEIGRLLAQTLGIPCYDKELIILAAQKSGMSAEVFSHVDETATNSFLYAVSAGSIPGNTYQPQQNLPLNDKLFIAQTDLIRAKAKEGACVFVGRCADSILKDASPILNVFIRADMPFRVSRIMEAENCTVELALDTGCLLGGGRELPFTEVEVELKAGPESAAAAFAQALAAEFGLTPEPKSKYRRALELAKNG